MIRIVRLVVAAVTGRVVRIARPVAAPVTSRAAMLLAVVPVVASQPRTPRLIA